MSDIWPVRTVALPSAEYREGEPWLADDKVAQVLQVVAPESSLRVLDKPVVLDSGTVRLIALVVLGEAGVGQDTLLLRVTDEWSYNVGHIVRLAVVTESIGWPLSRIMPGEAGDILDGLVQQIRAIPGLVPQPGPDRFGPH